MLNERIRLFQKRLMDHGLFINEMSAKLMATFVTGAHTNITFKIGTRPRLFTQNIYDFLAKFSPARCRHCK